LASGTPTDKKHHVTKHHVTRHWQGYGFLPGYRPPEVVERVRIPIEAGRVFRREAGHRSDLMSATIPK
jgi:hypothetical protein